MPAKAMNTMRAPLKAETDISKTHPRVKPRFTYQEVQFPEESPHSLIQWPTEQKIFEVSKKLAQIKKLGIRSEATGDYFNSGDLAYQIQEIIRATADLFQKSQRIKK
jgi:hypothetical protein